MTTATTGTKRRALLQRGLALLAGGAAMAGGTRWVRAASPPPPGPLTTLTLYTRQRPFVGPPGAGHQHVPDGRLVASGDLFDAPDGKRIGTFVSNCFCLHSSFGPQTSAASNLEFHVLELADGTLFSIGSGGGAEARPLAIVGGTNRYAGRSGSYIERTVGDDVRELVITFAV